MCALLEEITFSGIDGENLFTAEQKTSGFCMFSVLTADVQPNKGPGGLKEQIKISL